MVLFEPIAVGLVQLRANKMRSLLTLLGVMIGVASVIGIVSLGEGLRRTVMTDFARTGGSTTVLVNPPQPWERKDGRWVRRAWQEHLSTSDLKAFYEETDQIRVAVPGVSGPAQLQYGKTTVAGKYTGTNEAYNEGFSWAVDMGRPLTAEDVRYARRVCVIGRRILKDLFQDRDPIGEEIKLNRERYTVVGVLEERIRFGQEVGNQVFIPYTTAQKRLIGNRYLAGITLFIEELEEVERVAAAVRRVLRRRHDHGNEFRVETSQKQMEEADKVIGIMELVAGGIAGISLLVGGIGIMNIMLVSVTERTREIGIRKALGAKSQHLLFQFLAEAVVLSLFGGLLGVGLGMAFGLGIVQLIRQFAPDAPFSSVVGLSSIFWAMGYAAVVGIFFGVYPAFRAARMNPVEALRHE